MLNAPLHEAIAEKSGQEVAVLHEDEWGSFSCPPPRVGFLNRKQVRYAHVDDWGEVYNCNCPQCGDRRKRLFISHFHNCQTLAAGAAYLFGNVYICHNEHCDLRGWFRQLKTAKAAPTILPETKANKPRPFLHFSVNEVPLPMGCVDLVSDEVPESVLRYVIGRGFDPVLLHKDYLVKWARAGTVWYDPTKEEVAAGQPPKFFKEDRLMIPIINRRRLVGWQARRCEDAPHDKWKYLNPDGMKKSAMLYNLDRALFHRDVVITEGVTKVWRIGTQAVALFGNKAGSEQLQILKSGWSWNGSCAVLLDPDAKEESRKLAAWLLENKAFPRGVVEVHLPGKMQADDYSTDEINEILAGAFQQCKSP